MIDFDLMFRGVSLDGGYWMYDGSFTTPPCTEGVKWTVMRDIQTISNEQLDWLSRYTKGESLTRGYTKPDEAPVDGNRLLQAEDDKTINQKYLDYVKENTANQDNAAGNNRAIQELNSRTVLMAPKKVKTLDAASTLMASAAAMATIALLSF